MASSTVTADLVDRVHGLERTPLDARLARTAKSRLLQAVADAVAGRDDPSVREAAVLWSEHGGDPVVPALGHRQRLDILSATLVHGAAAYRTGRVPFGAAVPEPGLMAAVLSLAAAEGVAGDRVLTGFAVGCELHVRLVEASTTGDGHPWNPSHVCTPVAAAIAASILLAMTPLQTRTAMGIAAAQLVGHRVSDGTPLEPYLAGKAAANGVHAALLARAGLTGATDVLEHPHGFFAVVAPDQGVPPSLLADLGDRWRWLDAPHPDGDEARRQAIEGIAPVLADRTEALVAAIETLPDGSATAILEAGMLTEVPA